MAPTKLFVSLTLVLSLSHSLTSRCYNSHSFSRPLTLTLLAEPLVAEKEGIWMVLTETLEDGLCSFHLWQVFCCCFAESFLLGGDNMKSIVAQLRHDIWQQFLSGSLWRNLSQKFTCQASLDPRWNNQRFNIGCRSSLDLICRSLGPD